MDIFTAIRVHAYADVLSDKPTSDYRIRQIFRWFSEKFHTPLYDVYELPIYDVLQHYYEVHVEQLAAATDNESAEQLKQELRELGMTPEELRAWKDEEEAFEREVDEEAAAVAKKIAAKTAALAEKERKAGPKVFAAPEAGAVAPPDISLSFDDEPGASRTGLLGFKP